MVATKGRRGTKGNPFDIGETVVVQRTGRRGIVAQVCATGSRLPYERRGNPIRYYVDLGDDLGVRSFSARELRTADPVLDTCKMTLSSLNAALRLGAEVKLPIGTMIKLWDRLREEWLIGEVILRDVPPRPPARNTPVLDCKSWETGEKYGHRHIPKTGFEILAVPDGAPPLREWITKEAPPE